jgi:triacylglycerol esterase/lipase EstA (alpha/beta hydrolase family)
MHGVERMLVKRGYRVTSISYKWRTGDVVKLAANVATQLAELDQHVALDFVTHSLGGIVLRVAVAEGLLPPGRIRRVVMLGPPNEGSELADFMSGIRIIGDLYAAVTGPVGRQLRTAREGVPAQLPPVTFELGVIAGNRNLNPLYSAIFGGENDGRVRVDRARVAGMRDFIVVPSGHTMLVWWPSVLEQVAHFLKAGRFKR